MSQRKKQTLLETAADIFFGKVTKIERAIFKLLESLLGGFDTSSDRFRNIAANRRKLLSLDNAILSILGKAKLGDEISVFLKNFDEVERLNRLLYEADLSKEDVSRLAEMDFDLEKKFIIDDITRALTDTNIIKANIVKPIRDIIFESVRFERTLEQTIEALRDEIITSDGSTSKVLRYVKQISQDGLSQYDGALNDAVRNELELDGFTYAGSVEKTTRQNCFDLVRGVGKYEKFSLGGGKYRVSDIEEILSLAKRCEKHHTTLKQDCGNGFNSDVTPETFARYRMGYNCRHSVRYFRLLEGE